MELGSWSLDYGCKQSDTQKKEQWKERASSCKRWGVSSVCWGCPLHPHNKDIHECLVEHTDWSVGLEAAVATEEEEWLHGLIVCLQILLLPWHYTELQDIVNAGCGLILWRLLSCTQNLACLRKQREGGRNHTVHPAWSTQAYKRVSGLIITNQTPKGPVYTLSFSTVKPVQQTNN